MGILEKLEIQLGVMRGEYQFDRDVRAYNRAAGQKKNNGAKAPSDNTARKSAPVKTEKPNPISTETNQQVQPARSTEVKPVPNQQKDEKLPAVIILPESNQNNGKSVVAQPEPKENKCKSIYKKHPDKSEANQPAPQPTENVNKNDPPVDPKPEDQTAKAAEIEREMAEHEAPQEEPGAEIIESSPAAAMSSIVRPAEKDEDGINIFGVNFDSNLFDGMHKTVEPTIFQPDGNQNNQQSVPQPVVMPQQQVVVPQQVMMPPQQVPMVPQQVVIPMVYPAAPVVPMQPAVDPRTKFFNEAFRGSGSPFIHGVVQQPADGNNTQQTTVPPAVTPVHQMNVQAPPVAPIPGAGRHRADQPPVAKPTQPVNPPDNVDTTGMPNLVPDDMVNPVLPKKNVTEITIAEVDPNTVQDVPSTKELASVFESNNQPLIKRYSFLKDVENTALEKGYQLYMKPNQTNNMIECYVCDASGRQIPNKGFTIDLGNIIDGRKKVFAEIAMQYEDVSCYELFNQNREVDTELIGQLVMGGYAAVTKKPLFHRNYMDLNKVVALITMPTNKLKKDQRKYIQNRLVDVFNKTDVLKKYLGVARFRIEFSNGIIVLKSKDVEMNYGLPSTCNRNIVITITDKDVEEEEITE